MAKQNEMLFDKVCYILLRLKAINTVIKPNIMYQSIGVNIIQYHGRRDPLGASTLTCNGSQLAATHHAEPIRCDVQHVYRLPAGNRYQFENDLGEMISINC